MSYLERIVISLLVVFVSFCMISLPTSFAQQAPTNLEVSQGNLFKINTGSFLNADLLAKLDQTEQTQTDTKDYLIDRSDYILSQLDSEADNTGSSQKGGGKIDLEAISKEMDNPIGKLWLLFLQNDLMIYKGDPVEDEQVINATIFMPVLSMPLGDKWTFAVRPVLTALSAPKPDFSSLEGIGGFPGEFPGSPGLDDIIGLVQTDRKFELTDFTLMTLFGPQGLVAGKFVLAAGPTFQFPWATDNFFSSEKYTMGPAITAIYMGEKWKIGTIAQHWWSYAGADDRPDVSSTNIQYLVYYDLGHLWSVGAGPNIMINWEADNVADQGVNLPVGLGVNKTILLGGKLPVRFGVEIHYSVIHADDDFDKRWTFRFYMVPVIPNPFGGF